jgi:hypothetical protein
VVRLRDLIRATHQWLPHEAQTGLHRAPHCFHLCVHVRSRCVGGRIVGRSGEVAEESNRGESSSCFTAAFANLPTNFISSSSTMLLTSAMGGKPTLGAERTSRCQSRRVIGRAPVSPGCAVFLIRPDKARTVAVVRHGAGAVGTDIAQSADRCAGSHLRRRPQERA